MQESEERLIAQNIKTLAWLARAFAFSIAEDSPALRPYLSAVADEVVFEVEAVSRARVGNRTKTG